MLSFATEFAFAKRTQRGKTKKNTLEILFIHAKHVSWLWGGITLTLSIVSQE